MMQKIKTIFLNALPILIMTGLIPLISNDIFLMLAYVIIILISFFIYREKNEITIFIFGFLVMIAAETLFVSTGVETFVRNSLFGIMPLWLPFLWGYSFVAMKRAIKILNF